MRRLIVTFAVLLFGFQVTLQAAIPRNVKLELDNRLIPAYRTGNLETVIFSGALIANKISGSLIGEIDVYLDEHNIESLGAVLARSRFTLLTQGQQVKPQATVKELILTVPHFQEQVQGVDRFNQQAVDLLTGGAVDAIDLTREDPALLAKYNTSERRIGFKQFRPSMLGHKMLMARRLCEAGAGFVTVHSAGWDMHADSNNPGMQQGMAMLGTTMDHAVSAFLDDVSARGLSEKILLVITGDFGRTPRVNKKGGRDHWAKLGTLAFAGGGLNMGQVIGQSDRQATRPMTSPYTTAHLMGTIMQTLFDVGEMRLVSGIPPQIRRLVEESVSIPELMP